MLRYFFDTEFIDTPIATYPISIGIVCEDGREFYGELNDESIPWFAADQWVLDNVRPLLLRKHGTVYDSPASLGVAVKQFVDAGGQTPQFWAYFADWDWVIMIHLFGTMINTPAGWPLYAMDLKQWAVMLGNPQMPEQGGAVHNALEDARWNRKIWDFLALTAKGTLVPKDYGDPKLAIDNG